MFWLCEASKKKKKNRFKIWNHKSTYADECAVNRECLHSLTGCCTWLTDMKRGPNERAVSGNKGKDDKTPPSMATDAGCSQSSVSKLGRTYKQNGQVLKAKHTGQPRKTSKSQDG